MNDTDIGLLALLRANAREPAAVLAKKLRVSRGTVLNRLTKLEATGVIVGYTVRLKPAAGAQRIRAIASMAVDGNATSAVLQSLRGDPNVEALHTTNGRWDLVVELQADDLAAFDKVLNRLRLIPGIATSETSILLSTQKL
ncbi:Lrp/AsnC family transcriptional regulator [Variovorax sp. J31P207]|uniref:Lrp/AsnC family transcriptional regulator n=1 Tax=Variovorax sp. J31P207 TaxID=3053510 RepID=UPI002577AA7A|nr:Lrp/AsnC family transcriptional regulator [Variovorax sp. J31P207]MDM0071608.1 Lrp/AsnC family transcriptional regulator [Variovorax sp. J31P207]